MFFYDLCLINGMQIIKYINILCGSIVHKIRSAGEIRGQFDTIGINAGKKSAQIVILTAGAGKDDLTDGWIGKEAVITVIQPADVFAVIDILTLVIHQNNQRFIGTGTGSGIVEGPRAGDGILPLRKLHSDIQITGGNLIVSGLYDLTVLNSVCDLLVGKPNLSQQRDHAAEVIDIDNIIVYQMVVFGNAVMGYGEQILNTVYTRRGTPKPQFGQYIRPI